jgi:hypothetical protein
MHLITHPVHVCPCSNSAMKGNNGNDKILHHKIAVQTITEPSLCFTIGTEPGILDCKLSWVFSKCKLFLM